MNGSARAHDLDDDVLELAGGGRAEVVTGQDDGAGVSQPRRDLIGRCGHHIVATGGDDGRNRDAVPMLDHGPVAGEQCSQRGPVASHRVEELQPCRQGRIGLGCASSAPIAADRIASSSAVHRTTAGGAAPTTAAFTFNPDSKASSVIAAPIE